MRDEQGTMDGQDDSARRRILMGLGGLGLFYAALCIGLQAGLGALLRSGLAVGGLAFAAAIVLGVMRYRIVSIVIAGVVPLLLWLVVWGSYSFTRDLLGGALGLTLAWPAARLATQWRHRVRSDGIEAADLERPHRRFLRRYLIASFLLIWVLNSSLDLIFESGSEPRERTPLVEAQKAPTAWRDRRVGVALSGGGYRAALMHAGVLAELDAMQIPVTALSTVSGGSIIGSFYAAGGAPETFRAAIAQGRLNLKRDMADMHNALRMPFPAEIPYLDVSLLPWIRFGRVDVQANLVDRVFLGGTRLSDMQDPRRPRLQICASDLRSGAGVGLSSDGVMLRAPPRPAGAREAGRVPYEVIREFHPAIDPETRVASLVAASGAFPGAFRAVDMTLPAIGDRAALPLQLADGGIVDNWGVGLLLERFRAAPAGDPWRVDLLLISAGGRVFETDEDVPGPNQLRRAVDVIYETAGWRPIESVGPLDRPAMLLLQPRDADPSSPEYTAFAEANTLTDSFSEEQAQRLYDLGRGLVRDASDDLKTLLVRGQSQSQR